jgi:outer membrane protein OmpA-like peptidoglycan-associated protein
MLTKIAVASLIALPLLMACGTTSQTASADDAAQAQKAPSPDANVAVRQFVSAHAEVMGGIADIKTANRGMQSDLGVIKTSSQKSLETAQSSLKIIEEMANQQGTGELSVFFPNGSANLAKGSLEHDRLVRFADFLARESRGRKVILLSIGSASSYGKQKTNTDLAKKRAEVPLDIMDKYLVNVPHEFHKVFGNGDLNSPKDVKMKEHQRYQHTRVIAVFDKERVASINPVVAR